MTRSLMFNILVLIGLNIGWLYHIRAINVHVQFTKIFILINNSFVRFLLCRRLICGKYDLQTADKISCFCVRKSQHLNTDDTTFIMINKVLIDQLLGQLINIVNIYFNETK